MAPGANEEWMDLPCEDFNDELILQLPPSSEDDSGSIRRHRWDSERTDVDGGYGSRKPEESGFGVDVGAGGLPTLLPPNPGRWRAPGDDDDGGDGDVFLPRQPVLLDGGGQAEENGDESSDDEEDDAMPGGEAGGGGGIWMIVDAPLSCKKARLVNLIKSPPPPPPPPPCSVRHKKIGSEEAVQEKNNKGRRFVDGGELKLRPAVRGKKSRGPGREASDGSHPAADQQEPEGASKRFICNICGRCFGSYQALGGHVLGHKKKAKKAAIAAAERDETMTTVAVAAVSQTQNFITGNNGQGEHGCDGDSSRSDEENPFDDESRARGKARTASAIDAVEDADHSPW
ncbi:hypothetical protein E2562_004059 [Oryza meyeriana var. granulata]|uniref:C2H2-type domain-containing protein n=1 Tax=Oryza meyeriana var. granulata TaxID=110450 RepID=A0A6G1BIL6_9ORYZ|nr:hypothetical protein E2562_004059 [Oryza meyeriana var. granulata]